jgi:lipopolysaccharide export system protein LptA
LKHNYLYKSLVFAVIAVSLSARAQVKDAAAPGGDRYHVEADVTEGYYEDDQLVLHGTGNVLITHGEVTITCDEAWSYEDDRIVVLKGNVHVVNAEDKTELTGEYGEYYEKSKRAVMSEKPVITGPSGRRADTDRGSPASDKKVNEGAEPAGEPEDERYHVEADVTEGYMSGEEQVLHGIGNVLITHGETKINCDEAWSYEKEGNAVLKGNVRMVNEKENYVLTSQYGEYFEKTKLAVASKGPKLVLTGDRPVTITGDIMRMYTETEEGEVAGNAHVVSEDVEAFGETLLYFGEEERVELLGTPVAWQGDSRLAGDKLTMFFADEEVTRLLVEGNARVIYFAEGGEAEEETEAAEPEGPAIEVLETGGEPVPLEETTGGEDEDPEAAFAVPNDEGGPDVELVLGEPSDFEAPPAVEEETGEEEEKPPTGRVEASGDVIDCLFDDGRMEKIYIIGSARGAFMPFDELGRETGEKIDSSGDRITVYTRENEVKKIIVEGSAVGVYRPAETVGREGVTRTEGDTISVYMREREVRRIVVHGHARGSYFTKEASAEEEGKAEAGETGS